jgi:light-regulated signal transduction histidine kinase (bacteriophytochrome)
MKFVLFGIAIYILSYYNYMTEAELAESNQKLQDQTAELQRSNHDLEQFAAIISHDLKAPVRNVSSFMSLLMRRHGAILDSEAQNFIELSKNSADRMARQIDDLLSYSKVGRNLPATGTVDLNSMIAVIQIELGEKIKDKNTRIMILDELPILRNVHASMIHHIFQNLISNAVKFNTGDRPEVKIGSTMSADDYTFSVSDNGIGIDDDHKDKLFNMFRRLHSESEFEGSGVGLAVCKKIVDFYGGRIWMESTKGIGTTFYFTLPRRRGATSLTYSAKFTDVAYSQPVLAS